MGMFKITLLILNAVLWAWNAIHHPVATKSNHPILCMETVKTIQHPMGILPSYAYENHDINGMGAASLRG